VHCVKIKEAHFYGLFSTFQMQNNNIILQFVIDEPFMNVAWWSNTIVQLADCFEPSQCLFLKSPLQLADTGWRTAAGAALNLSNLKVKSTISPNINVTSHIFRTSCNIKKCLLCFTHQQICKVIVYECLIVEEA
jgi:hypothetical protein